MLTFLRKIVDILDPGEATPARLVVFRDPDHHIWQWRISGPDGRALDGAAAVDHCDALTEGLRALADRP